MQIIKSQDGYALSGTPDEITRLLTLARMKVVTMEKDKEVFGFPMAGAALLAEGYEYAALIDAIRDSAQEEGE